jgi:ATP-dependent Lhr-like helicase
MVPPTAEGRWTLVTRVPSRSRSPEFGASASEARRGDSAKASLAGTGAAGKIRQQITDWAGAVTEQLLARHGVLTREAVAAESIPGGFGVVYPVLKAMEEAGRIRRGYFVAGLGATQFALPGALDLLRSFRTGAPDADGQEREVLVLAATDPANPYGATLPYPSPTSGDDTGRRPSRSVGATVILLEGTLAAYLARGDRMLLTWLPEAEHLRSRTARAVARVLIERARSGTDSPRGMLIEEIDGGPPSQHPLASFLVEAGFQPGAMGYQATYARR